MSLDSEKITAINQEKSPSNFIITDTFFSKDKDKSPTSQLSAQNMLLKGITENQDESFNMAQQTKSNYLDVKGLQQISEKSQKSTELAETNSLNIQNTASIKFFQSDKAKKVNSLEVFAEKIDKQQILQQFSEKQQQDSQQSNHQQVQQLQSQNLELFTNIPCKKCKSFIKQQQKQQNSEDKQDEEIETKNCKKCDGTGLMKKSRIIEEIEYMVTERLQFMLRTLKIDEELFQKLEKQIQELSEKVEKQCKEGSASLQQQQQQQQQQNENNLNKVELPSDLDGINQLQQIKMLSLIKEESDDNYYDVQNSNFSLSNNNSFLLSQPLLIQQQQQQQQLQQNQYQQSQGQFLRLESVSKHVSYMCNSCGKQPIIGVRYKCIVCPNFDFCEICEESNQTHNHPFLKIKYADKNNESIQNFIESFGKKELKQIQQNLMEKPELNNSDIEQLYQQTSEENQFYSFSKTFQEVIQQYKNGFQEYQKIQQEQQQQQTWQNKLKKNASNPIQKVNPQVNSQESMDNQLYQQQGGGGRKSIGSGINKKPPLYTNMPNLFSQSVALLSTDDPGNSLQFGVDLRKSIGNLSGYKAKSCSLPGQDNPSVLNVKILNKFVATFVLQNSGDQTWSDNTIFKCIQGCYEKDEKQGIQQVGQCESKQLCTIKCNLDAPAKEGKYSTAWRLAYKQNNNYQYFGPRITLDIVVSNK